MIRNLTIVSAVCLAASAMLSATDGHAAEAQPRSAPIHLVPATVASGYEVASGLAQQRSGVAISFPGMIPIAGRLYAYANPLRNRRRRVEISFDRTADCHGAHVCAIGSFTVANAPIEILRDMSGRVITRVDRAGVAYTPEHAAADTFPARIQWRVGSLTYTVDWSGLPPERARATLEAVMRSAGTLPG